MFTTTRIVTVAAIAAVLVLLFALVGPAACTSLFTAKKEAAVSKGQGKAAIESGVEAMNTVSNTVAAEAEADKELKQHVDEIRKAPEAERSARTLDASCGLKHNAGKARCQKVAK